MADAISAVTADETGATERILASMPPLQQRLGSTNDNLRAIWRSHGPKVAAQTRQLVDGLIGEARRKNIPVERLTALRERLL
jgi:hypothetical protein